MNFISKIKALLLLLLFIPGLISHAQENRTENKIIVLGQLTNDLNGGPINNHTVIIHSDSVLNNGFYYHKVLYTDDNGFYFDTLATNINDGTITVSLYDYENHIHAVDKYFRFNWSEEHQVFANFEIYHPNVTSYFQANFASLEDPFNNDPMEVHFFDVTFGGVVSSWFWDFGDGIISHAQNPVHRFNEAGVHMVSLTVVTNLPDKDIPVTSTIAKMVTAGMESFYNMGGHVFADYFPIDYGLAYLYFADGEDQITPIDTAVIDELGYYYFYQIMEGDYIVKARLQGISEHYGNFIPTYFGDSYVWKEAELISLKDESNFECDIDLITSDGVIDGQGKIHGKIVYDTTNRSAGFDPASQVEIILLNDNQACLNCKLSDDTGYFLFPELAFGTYQLFPEVTGANSQPLYITITEETPGDEEVSVVITTEEITFGINDQIPAFLEESSGIYPNPAADIANIDLTLKKETSFQMAVSDMQGKTAFTSSYTLNKGNHHIRLDVRNLSPGIYNVVFLSNDQVVLSEKLIKIW